MKRFSLILIFFITVYSFSTIAKAETNFYSNYVGNELEEGDIFPQTIVLYSGLTGETVVVIEKDYIQEIISAIDAIEHTTEPEPIPLLDGYMATGGFQYVLTFTFPSEAKKSITLQQSGMFLGGLDTTNSARYGVEDVAYKELITLLNKVFQSTADPLCNKSGSVSAIPTTNRIYLELEHEKKELNSLSIYSIQGKNYFRLRDIGEAMNFNVIWNAKNNEILILLDKGYDLSNTNTAIEKNKEVKQGISIKQQISINNKIKTLCGYNIDGYTYFSIRDIAELANYSVIWDSNSNSVSLKNNI